MNSWLRAFSCCGKRRPVYLDAGMCFAVLQGRAAHFLFENLDKMGGAVKTALF